MSSKALGRYGLRQSRLYHFERIDQCCESTYAMRRSSNRPRTCVSSRPFSSTDRNQAAKGNNKNVKSFNLGKNPLKTMPALNIQMEKSKREGKNNKHMMLNQLGILPDTFVPLDRKDRPHVFRETRARWTWEKARLRYWWTVAKSTLGVRYLIQRHDAATIAAMPFFRRLRTQFFDRPPLRLRGITSAATALYSDMYHALAAGDLRQISDLTRPGMERSLTEMVEARRPGTEMTWRLDETLSKPRLVSWNIAALDPTAAGNRQTLVVQAVVRMHTRQVLGRAAVAGAEAKAGEGRPKDVKEWFVVQHFMLDGKWQGDRPKAWGMTKPTSLREIEDK